MTGDKRLAERRRQMYAAFRVIKERDRFLSIVGAAASARDLADELMESFDLDEGQLETVLNLQVRHFTDQYRDRFADQVAALDDEARES